jgi:hypothetical protein
MFRSSMSHRSPTVGRSSAGYFSSQLRFLALGLKFPRVVRRIFVSLGVLIAIDGITLLLMAVIVH